MIIPIGHQESTVRRLPWVTFGIMAFCTLVLIATPRDDLYDLGYMAHPLDEAAEYWREHAYLDPHQKVLDYVGQDVRRGERETYLDELVAESYDWHPDSHAEVLKEQMTLEVMTDRALAGKNATVQETDNWYLRFGLIPERPSIIAIFSHIFMHAGWLHLLGNLMMLFIAGPALEDRWGRPLFGAFFVLSGVLGGLFYMAMTPDSSAPLVGASGAIAGTLGAFLVMFAKTKIRFAYFFFVGLRWFRGTFESPAWAALPIWFGNELLQAYLMYRFEMSDGVAYWAHVGGFMAGAGIAYAILRSGVEEKFIHGAIESKITYSSADPAVEQASALREEGQLEEATNMLAEAMAKNPDDPDLALSYWDAANAAGRAEEAKGTMLSLVRTTARSGDAALAVQHWTELVDRLPMAFADPDTLLRLVPALVESHQQPRIEQALRQALDTRNPGLTPGQALRIMETARELDPSAAVRAGMLAIALSDMPENKVERIEQQIEELKANGAEDPGNWEPQVDLGSAPQESWERGEAIEIEEADDLSKPPPEFQAAVPATPKPLELTLDGDLGDAHDAAPLAEAEDALDLDALGVDVDALGIEAEELSSALEAEGAAMLAADEDDYVLGAEEIPISGENSLPPLGMETSTALPQSSSAPTKTENESSLPPIDGAAAAEAPLELEGQIPADAIAAAVPLAPIALEDPTPAPATPVPPPLPATPPPPPAVDAPTPVATDDDILFMLSDEPSFPSLKVIDARPSDLAQDALYVQLNDERKSKIGFDQIQAVAVAAVGGLSPKSVVVVDLLLNWSGGGDDPLRAVRFRSDRFDPRPLAPDCEGAGPAFRAFLSRLLEATGGVPLPDRTAATGERFASFDDLEAYEREVLRIAHV
jgi:membrane associated rhomboid family serine protease